MREIKAGEVSVVSGGLLLPGVTVAARPPILRLPDDPIPGPDPLVPL
jgi:hypothetical protein